MSELVQIPVHHYEDKGQLSDGSRKLVLYTPELSDDQNLALVKNARKAGWFVYKPNALVLEDIPEADAAVDNPGAKKPSARLRGVLWHIWNNNTDHSEDFDTIWYPRKMNLIIEHYKQELD